MYQNHRHTNYLGPWKASFVERFIILCPYLGGSTIGGSTVYGNILVAMATSSISYISSPFTSLPK